MTILSFVYLGAGRPGFNVAQASLLFDFLALQKIKLVQNEHGNVWLFNASLNSRHLSLT